MYAALNGNRSNALSLHSKVQSGGGGSQAIYVQNVGMGVESVTYQRMWIKFDDATLYRAQVTGADRFHQTFIERGLDLRFETTGRPPRRSYPTYRDLLRRELQHVPHDQHRPLSCR